MQPARPIGHNRGPMSEGIISTHTFRETPDGKWIEVIATLDAGEALPGMFIHIPINGMLNFTLEVADVSPLDGGRIRILLEGGDGSGLVMAFDFEDETLEVLSTG